MSDWWHCILESITKLIVNLSLIHISSFIIMRQVHEVPCSASFLISHVLCAFDHVVLAMLMLYVSLHESLTLLVF